MAFLHQFFITCILIFSFFATSQAPSNTAQSSNYKMDIAIYCAENPTNKTCITFNRQQEEDRIKARKERRRARRLDAYQRRKEEITTRKERM